MLSSTKLSTAVSFANTGVPSVKVMSRILPNTTLRRWLQKPGLETIIGLGGYLAVNDLEIEVSLLAA